jgi:hypothetical protein
VRNWFTAGRRNGNCGAGAFNFDPSEVAPEIIASFPVRRDLRDCRRRTSFGKATAAKAISRCCGIAPWSCRADKITVTAVTAINDR